MRNGKGVIIAVYLRETERITQADGWFWKDEGWKAHFVTRGRLHPFPIAHLTQMERWIGQYRLSSPIPIVRLRLPRTQDNF